MIKAIMDLKTDERREIIKNILENENEVEFSAVIISEKIKDIRIADYIKRLPDNSLKTENEVDNQIEEFKKKYKSDIEKWNIPDYTISRDIGTLNYYKVSKTKFIKIHTTSSNFKLLIPYKNYIKRINRTASYIQIKVDNRYIETFKALFYDSYEEQIYGVVGGLGIVIIYPIKSKLLDIYSDIKNLSDYDDSKEK